MDSSDENKGADLLPATTEWPNFENWRTTTGNAGELQGVGDPPRDALGRILPGYSLNPAGKKKGTEHFRTIFEKALKSVAAANKIDPEDLRAQIISKGIQKASGGDYRFYKDLLDRLYGKPEQSMDITSGGEKIPQGNAITFVSFKTGHDSDRQ